MICFVWFRSFAAVCFLFLGGFLEGGKKISGMFRSFFLGMFRFFFLFFFLVKKEDILIEFFFSLFACYEILAGCAEICAS